MNAPEQTEYSPESMAFAKVWKEFSDFVAKIAASERAEYFHPMNRSNWMKDFASYLIEKNKEASND